MIEFMEEANQKSKLSFSTKFFYGFGSISFGIKNNGFSYFVLFVYVFVFGLPAWMAGLALNLILVADAFTDPLVGYYSDRLRSKWGRRHPFMYAAAIPVTLSFYFLWSPPDNLTNLELFFYLLICATIIRVFITFYEIPSIALGPELTDNYVERTSLMSYRYFFGWFGGLTTYNLVWWYYAPKYETEIYTSGRFNPDLWPEWGLVAAILIFLGIVVTSLGTHKHIPNLIEPPKRKKKEIPEGFNNISIFNRTLKFNLPLPKNLKLSLSGVTVYLLKFILYVVLIWIISNVLRIFGFILASFLPFWIKSLQKTEFFLRSLFKEVAETLTINRSYKFLFFCGLLVSVAGGIEAAFAVIFDSYFWELDDNEMLIRGTSIYLAPIIAIFLAPMLSDKFGKKQTVLSIWAFQIIFAALPFALRYLDLTYGTSLFPTNDSPYLLPVLCIHVVINVAAGIIVFSTMGSMIMDLVEDIQLETGRREEGILFSARTFADKAVSGFGLTLAGVILTFIAFPDNTQIREIYNGTVPSEILADLALWYVPICIVAFGAALIMVRGYTLSRDEHEENIANPDTKVWKGD
ncbi:MAG: MFS transporter [SAR86 cluster bacterium]|jgi:Na+/melibiose symporter-like transporter|nr:MFS transporter [SAR86 cluster bacterium]